MATKNQRYRVIGIALCIVGGVLVVLGLAEELFNLTMFDNNPLGVGAAVGFIGALLAFGDRRKNTRDADSRVAPRS